MALIIAIRTAQLHKNGMERKQYRAYKIATEYRHQNLGSGMQTVLKEIGRGGKSYNGW